MNSSLVVGAPGVSTLIQDRGRPGNAYLGVSRSGATDRASHERANVAVGNGPDAAVLETLGGGLVLTSVGANWISLAGATCTALVEGRRVRNSSWIPLQDGETLALLAPARGLRTYVAVRGGIAVPEVLGSRSFDTLAALGPAPLRRGDILPIGPLVHSPVPRRGRMGSTSMGGTATLHAWLGPDDDELRFPRALFDGEWEATSNSSRVALRLARPGEQEPRAGAELGWRPVGERDSAGIICGFVQIPPSGLPVVFLADAPVTGGYPVVAVLRARDCDRAAQVVPGERVRFVELVTTELSAAGQFHRPLGAERGLEQLGAPTAESRVSSQTLEPGPLTA